MNLGRNKDRLSWIPLLEEEPQRQLQMGWSWRESWGTALRGALGGCFDQVLKPTGLKCLTTQNNSRDRRKYLGKKIIFL